MLGIGNGIGVPFGSNAAAGGGGFTFDASIRFDGSNDYAAQGGLSTDGGRAGKRSRGLSRTRKKR